MTLQEAKKILKQFGADFVVTPENILGENTVLVNKDLKKAINKVIEEIEYKETLVKYSIYDFIYWFQKYNADFLYEKKFSESQIASIVAKAMINFFEDSDTPY